MQEEISPSSERNNFCRKTYPWILRAMIGMALLSFMLLLLIAYFILFPWRAEYFAFRQNQQPERIVALDAPIVSRSEIIRWASQSAVSIYNFDFSNWEVRLQEASSLFTKNGFTRFEDALKIDGVLGGIIGQKLQMTAVLTGPAVIVSEGILAGRYSWKVNMPVLLTYTSSSETRKRNILVTMLISRVGVSDSPRGFAIEQFYEESA